MKYYLLFATVFIYTCFSSIFKKNQQSFIYEFSKVTSVDVYLGVNTIKPMDSSFILRKVDFSNVAIHEDYHIEACRYDV